ncbi:metallophosphoesterase [Heyndrickxia acidicola]|uniref:Phosphoesterase n=1 Tax=Heyndrickxia acidicola TaxID=209389 RepID=A0ABU6MK33_9BACI|nr:metallophosphoesterase [Heyndrickxia acidicola]MED1204834.1 metallophosphoesterase [Heyndrickxia acidicola]
MRLLVVSDSHGLTAELMELKEIYQNQVDAMIHCGDSELQASHPEIEGFLTVRGNCDFERRFPLDIRQTIGDNTIFITHGHHYNVKMTLLNLSYKAKEIEADFVFFGHSHVLGVEIIDGTIFLNPGSILLPRGRKEKTYALVEKEGQEVFVTFFDDQHKEIKELKQRFTM